MSWKAQLQVLDLNDDDRIELTCRICGRVRWLSVDELKARKGASRLTLLEVEGRAKCRQRGCGGAMRLALPRKGATKAFVGGLA